MYKFFYRLLTGISILAVIAFSTSVIISESPYLYSESDGTIAVNEARLDIESDFEEIALEHSVLIAKQIPVKSVDGKSGNQITFQTFGQGTLPENWIEQNTESIIERSSDDVLYFIIGDGLSAQELVDLLNAKGNLAILYQTSWMLIILNGLLLTPSIALGLFLILLALSSLIFAEKVSALKKSGIERLSGMSNWRIASKGFINILFFNFSVSLFASLGGYLYLRSNSLTSFTYLSYLLTSALLWLFLLLLNCLISMLIIFFVLNSQAIHQVIKGYAPVRLLALVILCVQLLSVVGLVISVASVLRSQEEITELKKAELEWGKMPEWFSPSLVASISFGDFERNNLYAFLEEAQKEQTMIIAADNLNEAKDDVFFPSYPDNVSNVIYVSPNFLTEQGIVSDLTGADFSNRTAWVLVPESQAAQKELLVEAWGAEMVSNSDEEGYPIEDLDLDVQSALYDDSDPLFSYRIVGDLAFNNRVFSQSPILLVLSPETWYKKTNFASYFTSWISQQQLIFSDPELTTKLIEKHGLQDNMGSYTNGLYAVQSSIIEQQRSQIYLTIAASTAVVTSLVLLSILNTIYLYQNRRKFVIQRLAGLTNFAIHWRYLLAIFSVLFAVSLGILAVGFPLVLELVPLVMLLLVFGLFYLQLEASGHNMLQNLKGE